jgi:hypothetical protein
MGDLHGWVPSGSPSWPRKATNISALCKLMSTELINQTSISTKAPRARPALAKLGSKFALKSELSQVNAADNE